MWEGRSRPLTPRFLRDVEDVPPERETHHGDSSPWRERISMENKTQSLLLCPGWTPHDTHIPQDLWSEHTHTHNLLNLLS